jgi:stearoyl-CoA desaturase (delta-9 desaturase)
LEYIVVTIGAVIGGGPPLHWVAEHRLHHRFSDTAADPHDATEGFWHAHVAHLFYHKEFEDDSRQWMAYIPDLNKNRYYLFLNRAWIPMALLALVPLYYWGGISYLLWGGFVRFVLMMHIMWFVNSASHIWGYRNFETRDAATNCWWVGLLAAGEGWHNNHHAYPTSAPHGLRWWEFDLTYMIICALEKMGLATDVKRPAPALNRRAIVTPT